MRMIAVVSAVALLFVPCAVAGAPPKLPPRALHGNEYLLDEFPTVSLATPAQRAGARRLLDEVRAASERWPTVKAAAAAGFDTHTVPRQPGDLTVHFLHAENHRYSHDSHFLDPEKPEALIYANPPGRPLVLVGLMFAMPRGLHGPTPGGPITRWHTHTVCARGDKRGLTPLPNGSCPAGTTRRQGGEMMHVWLTKDLRSAFAIHAPGHALGLAHLLPAMFCGH